VRLQAVSWKEKKPPLVVVIYVLYGSLMLISPEQNVSLLHLTLIQGTTFGFGLSVILPISCCTLTICLDW
jgi:hypothetical protein